MNAQFLARVRIITAIVLLLAVIIVGRLYFLQIWRGSAYTARADAQFVAPQTPLMDRDAIYFTAKDGSEALAASMQDGFTLAVNPTKVGDPEALYAALSAIVPLNHDDFIAKATKPNTQYQIIANHLDASLGIKIQQENLPGVVLAEDRWRVYPGGSLAAQELGFVAYNGDVQVGRYGLEQEYDTTLTRQDGDLYSNFFVELFSGVKGLLQGATQTGSLITTIEPSVQAELERTLAAYEAQWHAQIAGGIIMDPKTGSIYAMAANPTFDLNDFGAQTDPGIYSNQLVQGIYEMGSIMKPLTMAAGLDSGAIVPEQTYNDTGCLVVDTKKICNFDLKPRGVIPMQQILSQSLNVGASFIANQMGSSTMRNYFINHFALGSTTGIDLPGEQKGLVVNLYQPEQIDYDTASYGQGIAISPITMIRALATLANGGYLVTPHIVSAIHYDTGITKSLQWPAPVAVLKPQTAAQVSTMLTTVVDTAFTKGMSFEHYSVAAKTGTAQIPNPATKDYYPDVYLHSYMGYFPATNPQFIIFLYGYKPVGAPYSSETWGSYFHGLVQFLINYYNVAPDR